MRKGKLSWNAEVLLATLSTEDKYGRQLQQETGFDRRTMMKAVNELRKAGYKVCAGNYGYHLWNGKDETWNETKRRVRSQAYDMMELYRAMER